MCSLTDNSPCSTKTRNATLLVSQMEADLKLVAKDLQNAKEKLAVDAENDKYERDFQHQEEIKLILGDAEGRVRDLFLNLGTLKSYKDPHASKIEDDISNLHSQWLKDTADYVKLYEQIDDVSLMPRIDWAPVFTQKQVTFLIALSTEEYGPTMEDLKKQIAAHSILQKELEAYSSQLCVSSEKSKLRQQYLVSLYEYMQGCNKELKFLGEEQDKVKKQDWSDHMEDPPDIRRQYEHFKNNSLLSHESDVNKLQDDGDTLIEMQHPASSTIEAQRNALRSEWQKFLNLCICKEAHLDNVEEFTKVSKDGMSLRGILYVDTIERDFKWSKNVWQKLSNRTRDCSDRLLSSFSETISNGSGSTDAHNQRITSLFLHSAPVSSTPLDPKAAALAQQLEQLDAELANTEESMLSSMRTPVSRSDPSRDLARRLKEQEQTAKTLQALEQQRAQAGQQLSSGLPLKYDNLAALTDLYRKKTNASLNLENQINKVDGLVSGFERNLSVDGPIPDIPNAIQTRAQDIQRQRQSVAAAQDDMKKLNQDLEITEKMCSSLQQDYQEYCPDIQRQRNEVKQLQSRYANVANQLKERENVLQEASATHKDFQNTCQSLNSFLDNLPTNQINSKDDLSQITAKQSSQKRVVDDLKRKDEDMDRVADLSHDLQNLLNSIKFTFVQLESQQKNVFELDSLIKELEEEKERTAHVQTELKTFKSRMMSLKSRRGVERLEEREVLQYYRDPKLETDLADLKDILSQETLKRSTTQTQVENVNKKIIVLEDTIKSAPPKLLTREVTEFEKDPQLDVEAAKIRDEIARMRDEIRVKDGEEIQMKTEVTILQQKKPPVKQKVVKKEVVKVEQDPQMLKALRTFETELSDESNRCKLLNDEIFQTRSQINALERMIPNIQPKIITKEVKKIEQDPDLITESTKLKTTLEEEKTVNTSLSRELMELHNRYREVQSLKPRVEMKEIVNEIYRIDPNTETEIMRLRKEIQDSNKQRADTEKQIRLVNTDLNTLRSEEPRVELKEVLQEVVKEERSPENEREIQRLNDQVNRLDSQCTSLEDQVRQLRKQRDEWKAEKSRIETQLVNREVIKYEPDPLLEKEADRLRRTVREEAKMRRNTEERVFDLQHKYLLLERQKPEEKVVVQEVVRLQRDTRQVVEHDRLGSRLDEEVMGRRQLDLELQQLRTRLEDKERIIRESDEHQKRIQAESELREIRLRITQLENAPPPVEESIVVEEVLKVERDPKLERLTSGVRSDMDKETHDILRLQREIRNITVKLEILQKEKSGERTVYKEVVRVEKDQAVEAERDRLREQVSQNKFARQDMEDEIRRLNDKINSLMNTKSNNSREETTLSLRKEALLREKDDLTRELRTLETKKHDTSLSYHQQSRLMSERTQTSRQKSLKMESDVQRLEKQILEEKDKIHQRDSVIRDIMVYLQQEEQAETRTKETNVSTRITILDPETGKDMSPYDAYLGGLIDRPQYLHLQELECDWEEITSSGPDGETSVLQDRKSGKQYPIKDALIEGRLTEYDLQQYKQGKLPISEFALLVAGDKNKQPKLNPFTQNPKSPSLDLTSATKTQPIAGIMDQNTNTCYTIRNATLRKLIDPTTAKRLLEAQAATGGITDISNNQRYKVNKATQRGLIDDSQVQQLLNAEKAFTGVEDPVTKEVLSVGEAVQKDWIPKDSAIRYMEAQHLTGGLVDPNNGTRVSLLDAIGSKMINNDIARNLQTDTAYVKDITDPITQEKINYKQALDRCKKDPETGLPMLLASVKDSSKYAHF
uniref:Envoplakin a n=1 Tax=Fundulus heteroclitus TaxID=8078 RepID=A0A3Q2UF83_FUNHE